MDTAVDVSTVAECDGKPCVAIKMDKNALSGTELDIGDVMFSKKNEIALDSSTDELTYEVCRLNIFVRSGTRKLSLFFRAERIPRPF